MTIRQRAHQLLGSFRHYLERRLKTRWVMSMLLRAIPALVLCSLFLAPPAASAQEPGSIPVPLAEVSGGYMFMRDFTDMPDGKGLNFPAGWYFSVAVNPTQWLGLVGEVGGSYKNRFDGIAFDEFRFSTDARVYTLMGGPRFFRKFGRVAPFAQVLAGVAHIRATVRFPDEIPGIGTYRDNTTDFAVQPGGGVTVYLTEHVGARVAGDYRTIINFMDDGNDYTNEFRVIAGFTLHWGGR